MPSNYMYGALKLSASLSCHMPVKTGQDTDKTQSKYQLSRVDHNATMGTLLKCYDNIDLNI